MRLTPTKILNALTGVIIVILLWTVFVQQSPSESRIFDSTCAMPERHSKHLHTMVYAAHEVLDSLDLGHFLCYGSLFGQIRHSASLPWEKGRHSPICMGC
jgi:hypothetical protein